MQDTDLSNIYLQQGKLPSPWDKVYSKN